MPDLPPRGAITTRRRAVVIGAIWLGSLPDVLRNAGLDVGVYPGWETRSRSSGGYDALLGIQCHHTASSGANPAAEMAYMWGGASAKPIGALYLAPSGRWTVGAAGATNTSGLGGPLATSRGTIPKDAANRYVISIEAANLGNGMPWPDDQLRSYVRGVAALNKAYFGGVLKVAGDVHAHHEWTTRKVDPAGQSWYATGANKWNMIQFRNDVSALLLPPPPITPTPTGKQNDMIIIDLDPDTPKWTAMQIAGNELTHLVNGNHVSVLARANTPRVTLGTPQVSGEDELAGILLSLVTTNDSPFAPGMPGANARLHGLWVAAAATALDV